MRPPPASAEITKSKRIKARQESEAALDTPRGFHHQFIMNICYRPSLIIAALCGAVALLAPAASQAGSTCPADPGTQRLNLPHLHDAVAGRSEGLIVALGSSSTEGAMASDSAHTYPAILQAELNAALPAAHIAVINRGIGGQDAPEELARLDTDAIAIRPQLVIWQVGANGAMRHADPYEFHRLVEEGVKRLAKSGIDVILMDNQRSPRILAAVDHIVLEESLDKVARETGVNLFSRSHLMDEWSDEGAKPGLFTASDGLHHNDLGYQCVTKVLAREITAAINTPLAVSASR
jgi:acyl-CoA thioesterase-1